MRGMARFVVLSGMLCAGCSYIIVGKHIDLTSVGRFVPGVTTEQEVLDRLGKPEAVTHKSSERITVYTYKALTHTGLGLPLPILQVGKSADRGNIVNIILKDGLVVDTERITLQEGY